MWRPLLLLCLAAAAAALAQTAPVFTLDFEQGFDGRSPAGAVKAVLTDKPALAPGRFGQALKSGPSSGYLQFPARLLSRESGTVEMWVCPLDWRPADREFHAFFDVRGDGALYLYKYVDGNNLLMLSCEQGAGPYFSSASPLAWQPGEWHHIAGTWSPTGVLSYVDGKPAGALPVPGALPRALGEQFTIGDHPWHLPRQSSSLVDEVRIYDRALSPAHLAAHAAGKLDFVAPLQERYASLTVDLDPERGAVQARVSTGGADVADAQVQAQVGLVARGAALPADAPSLPFAGGQAVTTLPVGMQPGEYEAVARVLSEGKPAFELRRPLTIPDTRAWRGSSLGKADVVLPPWSPLSVQGRTVHCWGRAYDFATPLPGGLRSAGAELLAGTPAVNVTAGGQRLKLKASDVRVTRQSPTRCRLEGRLQYGLGQGSLTLTTSTTVEYDGLIWTELACDQPAQLQGLSVEFALPAARALYRHRHSAGWNSSEFTGLLPSGEGVVDRSGFLPYYWLGDNDRGLFWFCETDEMWPNGRSDSAVEVVRQGQTVALRLNLLAEGQKLPAGWRYAFGLQATPVKPLPAHWRAFRLQPGRNGNVSIMWPTPQKDSIRYFGYPEATEPALFAARVDKLHAAGVRAVPYLCLSFLSAACPEWPFFRKFWAMGPVDASSSDVAQYGAGFAMVSPVGKDYADFIVAKTADCVKRYGLDGLYHDNTHPYGSANLDAGVGYEREGQRRPTYPLLGYRELYRRMYAVLKGGPRPSGQTFSMAHMSGKVAIPILAYEDAYLDGEHFRGLVKDSYLDLMSLETFRTEYMGRQWGLIPCFLPEFDAEHQKAVEPTRGLMALLMIHDVTVWPIWCNTEEANRALEALDRFGYVDAAFTGYWEAAAPAHTDLGDVHVSAYRRPDGQVLLIVANVGKEDREGTVEVDRRYADLAGRQVLDWPGGQALQPQGQRLALTVPRLGYRLLLVK